MCERERERVRESVRKRERQRKRERERERGGENEREKVLHQTPPKAYVRYLINDYVLVQLFTTDCCIL